MASTKIDKQELVAICIIRINGYATLFTYNSIKNASSVTNVKAGKIAARATPKSLDALRAPRPCSFYI